MRIYLAGAYGRREELLGYRRELEQLGHTVTARWLLGEHEAVDGDASRWQEFANDDLTDLLSAQAVVSFTEPPASHERLLLPYEINLIKRGGRHVEFGVALVTAKTLVVIGHRENIFHHLPEVFFYPNWSQALADFKEHRIL